MIAKVLDSGYNQSLFPSSVLLPQFSKGFDPRVLKKTASIFADRYSAFPRKKGYEYIHLISVAAGEQYGANSRADLYNGGPYTVTFPHPGKGVAKTRLLGGGIRKHHPTFLQHGAVYTEHQNKYDKAVPQGYIVAAEYNPEMHRGELIIGVESSKWYDDLERLSKGTPLKFSIGADAKYDICSCCGHEAHSEKEHCEHIKYQPGQVLDDGTVIAMISDDTLYHDISKVAVPAEKIAFSLRKVAGMSIVTDIPRLSPGAAAYFVKTASGKRRLNTLQKLSAIEKKITAMAKGDIPGIDSKLLKLFRQRKQSSRDHGINDMQELNKYLSYAQEDEVLGGLSKEKCILAPEEFIGLVAPSLHSQIDFEALSGNLPGCCTSMLESCECDQFCDDPMFVFNTPCYDLNVIAVIRKLKGQCGVDRQSLMSGLMEDSCVGLQPSGITVTLKGNGTLPEGVSRDYLNYFLSACEGLNDEELVTAALQHLIKL